MRILHTADWHLGDRLGRIDRTGDLRRAVAQIAGYCETERVDVLLIAGDLFSELARPDALRDAIRHLQETFTSFLARGGTIVAITGNHDNESFCQTLWHAMTLASPAMDSAGHLAKSGRLHLATEPTLLTLADRQGQPVQFALMPFPTPSRYFDEGMPKYSSFGERNQALTEAFIRKLRRLVNNPPFRQDVPSVLAAHLTVLDGSEYPLFRMTPQEDIAVQLADIPDEFAYVALGHIHKPKVLGGRHHVRYSSSIERLDLGEQNDSKGVVVFDIGPEGLVGEPITLPLDATPIYELAINSPKDQLPTLSERFPDAARDLVNLHITYTAGDDNLEEILRELEDVFPRWYARDWHESGTLGATITTGEALRSKSFEDTVRDYVIAELQNHDDTERQELLDRLERLLQTTE